MHLHGTMVYPKRTASATQATVHKYKMQGLQCAFGNVRLLGRVVGLIYDDAFRPFGLKATQFALLWAILASQPIEMTRLAALTFTDQTTLSRTIRQIARLKLVRIAPSKQDRRVRLVELTRLGRHRFAQVIPQWKTAQKEAAPVVDIERLQDWVRGLRKQRQSGLKITPRKQYPSA